MQQNRVLGKQALVKGLDKGANFVCRITCMIFFSIFLLQLLSFASSARHSKNGYFRKQECQSLLNADANIQSAFPFHSNKSIFSLDANIELAEDDSTEDSDENTDHSFQDLRKEERIYTSFIKSQFRRLNFSFPQKNPVPLFVLHHSWKSFPI